MKLKSPLLAYILSILYVIGAGYTMMQIIDKQAHYSEMKTAYAEMMTVDKRLLNVDEWISKKKTLQRKRQKAEAQKMRAEAELDEARFQGWLFLGYSLLLLLALLVFYTRTKYAWRVMAVGVLSISVCCLLAGILLPMLEVAFYKQDLTLEIDLTLINLSHTFEGDMYFFFQNKSIMQMIGLLFGNGSPFVAIIILLASVIIPLIKLTLSIMALFMPFFRNKNMLLLIERIGKWSMIDVMVVSIFLSILAVNNMETGVDADTHALPGLYFFATYVILSLVSFILVKAALKKEGKWPHYMPLDEYVADQLVGAPADLPPLPPQSSDGDQKLLQ